MLPRRFAELIEPSGGRFYLYDVAVWLYLDDNCPRWNGGNWPLTATMLALYCDIVCASHLSAALTLHWLIFFFDIIACSLWWWHLVHFCCLFILFDDWCYLLLMMTMYSIFIILFHCCASLLLGVFGVHFVGITDVHSAFTDGSGNDKHLILLM